MANTPYPLPRETRESAIDVGDGTAGPFGPSQYRVFDTADVRVFARAVGEPFFDNVTDTVTVTKTSNAAYDTFSVTFAAPIDAAIEWFHSARRVAERSVGVTRGGSIDSNQTEKELSKVATTLSEIRRDLGRTLQVEPGAPVPLVQPLAEGHFHLTDAESNLVDGGKASDIQNAQANAETTIEKAAEATAQADLATVARNEAQDARDGAETARDFAAKWASAPVDEVVDDGVNPPNKSAYHWSKVAEDKATEAATNYVPKNGSTWKPGSGDTRSDNQENKVFALGSFATSLTTAEWMNFNTSQAKFWFAKPVFVRGDIYAGPAYDKVVWHAGNGGAGSGMDADKLDGQHGAYYNDLTNATGMITDTMHGARGGGNLHTSATTSTAGFMSAADKTKLDGIEPGATAGGGGGGTPAGVLLAASDLSDVAHADTALANLGGQQKFALVDAAAAAAYTPVKTAPPFIEAGGNRYLKVASAPAQGGLQVATGVWYELDTKVPTVEMFGGGTGTPATDGAALEKLIAYVKRKAIKGATISITPATYQMTAGVDLPSGNRWLFNGSTLGFVGVGYNALVPMFGATANTHVACQGSKVALPKISGTVVPNQFILTFASAHGLKSGDIVEIYNPADYSWHPERPYYRAGELVRVMVVPDATTIWIDKGLHEGYVGASVNCSKYVPWTGSVDGLNIAGNAGRVVATYGFAADYTADAVFSHISAVGVSYQTHAIARSMDFKMTFCRGGEDGINDFDGDYGLGIYSSQRGVITDSHFVAARHGITHSCVDGSVPYRDIRFYRCSAHSHDLGVNTAVSWDYHAIGSDCSVTECVAGTGLGDQCYNLTVERCKIYNMTGYEICISSNRQKGGLSRYIDNEYIINGTQTALSFNTGVIHLANSTSHVGLAEDKFYEIRGVTIRGNNQRAAYIVAMLTQHKVYRVSVEIDGIDDPDINATRQVMLWADGYNASPIAPRRLAVKNVKRARSGVALAAYSRTLPAPLGCDYEPQEGTSATAFRYAYPETPRVVAFMNSGGYRASLTRHGS